MNRRTGRFLGLTLATVALAACDDSLGLEAVEESMELDAAVLAADATLEDVAWFGAGFGFAPALTGGVGRDFSGARSVTFYDADGAEQSAFDALTTASIHIVHEMSGTVTRDAFTAEVSRTRDMTVSGLAGEETHRTWNGSGTTSMAASGAMADGTTRSHSAEGSFAFSDVVVPTPGSDPRWPVSGTITRSMTMSRVGPNGTVTRDVSVVITFDGTSVASAVVNGVEHQIDLSAQAGRSPLRRGMGG
jgi:hypothetical protein